MAAVVSEIDGMKRAHGLRDGKDWLAHDAPAEWQVLNAAWDARSHEERDPDGCRCGGPKLAIPALIETTLLKRLIE